MKVKLLKILKKYWDYRFNADGSLWLRRKADGELYPYTSIRNFIHHFGLHNAPYRMHVRHQDRINRMDNERDWNSITKNQQQ